MCRVVLQRCKDIVLIVGSLFVLEEFVRFVEKVQLSWVFNGWQQNLLDRENEELEFQEGKIRRIKGLF